MADPLSCRVLGRLGPAASAPLLAERLDGEGHAVATVVLEPVGPGAPAAPDPGLSAHLVPVLDHLEVQGRRWRVLPRIPGADLAELRAAWGGPLDAAVAAALLLQVAGVVRRLHAAGTLHGDLSAGRVRIGAEGWIRLLPPATHEGDDHAALRGLLEDLVGVDDGLEPPDALRPALDASGSLEGLQAALRPVAAGIDLAASVGPALARVEPTLHPDPDAGRVLSAAAASSGTPTMPPKARLAATAAVTLLLGIGTGVVLAGALPGATPPPSPVVHVPGATTIRVDCEPFDQGGDRLDLAAATTCRVQATLSDGSQVEADLDGSLTRRYICAATEGGFSCTDG